MIQPLVIHIFLLCQLSVCPQVDNQQLSNAEFYLEQQLKQEVVIKIYNDEIKTSSRYYQYNDTRIAGSILRQVYNIPHEELIGLAIGNKLFNEFDGWADVVGNNFFFHFLEDHADKVFVHEVFHIVKDARHVENKADIMHPAACPDRQNLAGCEFNVEVRSESHHNPLNLEN